MSNDTHVSDNKCTERVVDQSLLVLCEKPFLRYRVREPAVADVGVEEARRFTQSLSSVFLRTHLS